MRLSLALLVLFGAVTGSLSCKPRSESKLQSNVDFPQGFVAGLKPDLAKVQTFVGETRQAARKISQVPADQINMERKKTLESLKTATGLLQSAIRKVNEKLAKPGLAQGVAAEASIREEDVRAQATILTEVSDVDMPAISESINALSTQVAANQPYIAEYDVLLTNIETINGKVDGVLAAFESWIGRFDSTGQDTTPEAVPAGAFRDLLTGLDWKTIEQWPGDDQLLGRCKSILGAEWRMANVFEIGNASPRLGYNTINQAFTFNNGNYTYAASANGQAFGYMVPSNRSFYNGANGNLTVLCVRQSKQFAGQFKDLPIRTMWHWLGQWDAGSSQLDRCKVLGQGWKLATRGELSNASPRLGDVNINKAFKVNVGNYVYMSSEDGTKIGYSTPQSLDFYQGENGYLDLFCTRNDSTELPPVWNDTVANRRWTTIGKWPGEDSLKDRCQKILGAGWKLALASELQNAAPRITNPAVNTAFKVATGDYLYVSMGSTVGYMTPSQQSPYQGFNGAQTVLCVSTN